MQRWKRLVNTIRSLAGRGPVHEELDAEVEGYLEMLVDEKVAAGLRPEEARRRARIEMGGVEQVKEAVRDIRPAAWLDIVARDLRLGLRHLARTPAFSVSAVLVLALGVAANVAVFGLVNLLLLQPRVGSEQRGSLALLHVHDSKNPGAFRRFSYLEFQEVQRHAPVFSSVAAHESLRVLLSTGEEAQRVAAAAVSSTYFSTFGVRLVAGRGFTIDEERPGSAAAVAVIGYDTWQGLGGNLSVLGRTISVNTHPFTVVGIAPQGFTGAMVAFGPRLWIPIGARALVSEEPGASADREAPASEAGRKGLAIAARLPEGTGFPAANAAVAALSPLLGPVAAGSGGHAVVTVHPMARTEDSDAPGDDSGLYAPLGTLAAMAAILLLVASLNVANMQLARGANRGKEIATRLALGAGRGRVMLQLLAEGFLLSVAAGAGGLLIGTWTLHVVAMSFTPVIDESLSVSLWPDVRVVLATVCFSLAGALVFALGPSVRLSRPAMMLHLKSAGGDAPRSGRWAGPRHFVVAFQVALSLALLVTAGLFVRGGLAAARVHPGFSLDRQVLVHVSAPGSTTPQSAQAFQELVERLRAAPDVDSVSAASLAALGSTHWTRRVQRPAGSSDPAASPVVAHDYAVGAGYFRTLGLAVLRGREFTEAEGRSNTDAAIVDEPLARVLYPGEDPVGREIEFPADANGKTSAFRIVGLVAGQRDRLTDPAPVPHIYRSIGSTALSEIRIHVRLTAAAALKTSDAIGRLRDVVRAAGPRVALLDIRSFEEARDRVPSTWLIRAAAAAFGALGLVALAMAVVGLYGVKAYLVARRSREIGIRIALGATPRAVVAMIVRDGSISLGLGLLAGFVLAAGAGWLVRRMLVGVRPLDPFAFLMAALLLAAAAGLACYLPARRATRLDPTLAMRAE